MHDTVYVCMYVCTCITNRLNQRHMIALQTEIYFRLQRAAVRRMVTEKILASNSRHLSVIACMHMLAPISQNITQTRREQRKGNFFMGDFKEISRPRFITINAFARVALATSSSGAPYGALS